MTLDTLDLWIEQHIEWLLAAAASCLVWWIAFIRKVYKSEDRILALEKATMILEQHDNRLLTLEIQFQQYLKRDEERYAEGRQRGKAIEDSLEAIKGHMLSLARDRMGRHE